MINQHYPKIIISTNIIQNLSFNSTTKISTAELRTNTLFLFKVIFDSQGHLTLVTYLLL
jgi:hypothetical protein